MRNCRRVFGWVLLVTMMWNMVLPVGARATGETKLYANKLLVDLAAPIMPVDQHHFMPVKALENGFNYQTTYEQSTYKFTLEKGTDTLVAQRNSNTVVFNGKEIFIKHAPLIVNSYTYICLEDFASILNIQVEVDEENARLDLYDETYLEADRPVFVKPLADYYVNDGKDEGFSIEIQGFGKTLTGISTVDSNNMLWEDTHYVVKDNIVTFTSDYLNHMLNKKISFKLLFSDGSSKVVEIPTIALDYTVSPKENSGKKLYINQKQVENPFIKLVKNQLLCPLDLLAEGLDLQYRVDDIGHAIQIWRDFALLTLYVDSRTFDFNGEMGRTYAGATWKDGEYYVPMWLVAQKLGASFIEEDDNISINSPSAPVTERTIDGKIQLPDGEAAPEGGIYFDVSISTSVHNDVYYNDTSSYQRWNKKLFIPEGQSEAPYRAILGAKTEDVSYSVKYTIQNYSNDYVYEGYYHSQGTVGQEYLAERISGNNNFKNIDIYLLKAKKIRGTVKLPPGKVAPSDGLPIRLSTPNYNAYNYTEVIIPEGQSQAYYSIPITKVSAENQYRVGYFVAWAEYYAEGFYHSAKTVSDWNKAADISVTNQDVQEIDLTLIECVALSGVVKLPDNEFASERMGIGIWAMKSDEERTPAPRQTSTPVPSLMPTQSMQKSIQMNTELVDQTGSGKTSSGGSGGGGGFNVVFPAVNYTSVTIEKDQNSAPFTIYIPADDDSAKYVVQYDNYRSNLPSSLGTKFMPTGYYQQEATVPFGCWAKHFKAQEGAQANLEFNLLPSVQVGGTIRLPDGAVAKGQLRGHLEAIHKETGNVFYSSVTINDGESASEFYVAIPSADTPMDYILQYYMYSENNDELLAVGYYSSSGTKTEIEKATPLALGDKNVFNLDFPVLPMSFIQGTVKLPDGEKASAGGLHFKLYLLDQYDNAVDTQDIFILEGNDKADYSLAMRNLHKYQTQYRIAYRIDRYDCASMPDNYLSSAYYHENSTTYHRDQATILSVTEENQTGKDITLLKGSAISGKISSPKVLNEPCSVVINAVPIIDSLPTTESVRENVYDEFGRWTERVPINNYGDYRIIVPNETNQTQYQLIYDVFTNDQEIVKNGFYTGNANTSEDNLAKLVDVKDGEVSGADISLMQGTVVSGKLSLPTGEVVPGYFALHIGIEAEPIGAESVRKNVYGMSAWSNSIYIQPGKNGIDYSLTLPRERSNNNYRIKYTIFSGSEYVRVGYYYPNHTVQSTSQAFVINAGQGNQTNIDLTLIKQSGTSPGHGTGEASPTPIPTQTPTPTPRPVSSGGGGGGTPRTTPTPALTIAPTATPVPTLVPATVDKVHLNKTKHVKYIQGFEDGSVKPDQSVSREQVAMMVYRLAYNTPPPNATAAKPFQDVDTSRWSAQAITYLKDQQVIGGYSDGSFGLEKSITRAEFVSILAKVEGLTPSEANHFNDTSTHWGNGLINAAYEKGWLTGFPDGTFAPNAPVTRAQAVVIINRILGKKADEKSDEKSETPSPFVDMDKSHWAYKDMLEATQ